jgi:hypothetical protein
VIGSNFYNKDVRKATVAFGALFNNITLVKSDSTGAEIKRNKVPLVYGSKEKYLARLQQDPENARPVGLQLPRMAFEIVGFKYDNSRKQQTMIRDSSIATGNPQALFTQYVPVPYDISFNLHILAREVQDGLQIMEQILPFFTPDYTVAIAFTPQLGVSGTRETPIVFNGIVDMSDNTEGPVAEVRLITWTLSFTMKTFLYGPTSSQAQILSVQIQYFDQNVEEVPIVVGNQTLTGNTIINSNTIFFSANASGKLFANDIVDFNGTTILLNNVTGNTAQSNVVFAAYFNWIPINKLYVSHGPVAIYTANVSPNTSYQSSYSIVETLTENFNNG